MYRVLDETVRVAYGDLCFMRRNIFNVIVSSMIAPLLYLVAFGYGMRVGSSEEGVDYIAYVIPGIMAITSMTAGFASTSQKILIQRLFHSSFDELVLCPMHISSIVLGKSVIGMVRGLMGAVIMLVLGLLLTKDIHLSPQLIVCAVFSCLTFAMMGVMAGLLAKSTPSLNMISNLIILPMTFMCGTLFSVDSLPEPAAAVLWVLPLTHSSEMMRATALDWSFPWVSLAVVAAYFILFFLIDCHIIKKGKY
ncbi:MAG: ABC transporter permease [Candidatus Methanoplasma sp.]|jgi:ABC-type multidrug transport system permease subunit|nr:ABC transporter permease [Candidatus Methanoplasma sp.]